MRALVLVLALAACAPPDQLVMRPGLGDRVIPALARLEADSGCSFYPGVLESDRRKYWARDLPPLGVTTIEARPYGHPDLHGGIGWADWSKAGARCRAYISERCGSACIAHELLHCAGYHEHTDSGVLRATAPTWGDLPKCDI